MTPWLAVGVALCCVLWVFVGVGIVLGAGVVGSGKGRLSFGRLLFARCWRSFTVFCREVDLPRHVFLAFGKTATLARRFQARQKHTADVHGFALRFVKRAIVYWRASRVWAIAPQGEGEARRCDSR